MNHDEDYENWLIAKGGVTGRAMELLKTKREARKEGIDLEWLLEEEQPRDYFYEVEMPLPERDPEDKLLRETDVKMFDRMVRDTDVRIPQMFAQNIITEMKGVFDTVNWMEFYRHLAADYEGANFENALLLTPKQAAWIVRVLHRNSIPRLARVVERELQKRIS